MTFICVLCEEEQSGEPKYYLELNAPLCKECYEESKKPPPHTFRVTKKDGSQRLGFPKEISEE